MGVEVSGDDRGDGGGNGEEKKGLEGVLVGKNVMIEVDEAEMKG
jgi:hypothetical protein